ncbi:hypothetical protein RMCBS344292_02084 [Rhizopus microsporus]|nr:hypothetical protein RMCBS344292_02084 [Rhizopus microsporus]
MSTKRRQSSYSAEEPFEFVDYTSVSNFERLVTHIEETLYSWGIKDGSFGIFSDEQISAAKAALSNPTAEEYTRKEVLSVDEDTFYFTYHCQPTVVESNNTPPLAADHFYQYQYNQYHPLHRWTGQSRLLILKLANDSIKKKILLGTRSSIENHQAKQLISACAIAFQNTGCSVPVFTPVGQERHKMFLGYMLTTSNMDHPLNETETRFNMTIISPPSTLSCLDELKYLFMQKQSALRETYGKVDYDDKDVWTTAVYTYDLKNWFENNWKQWPETPDTASERPSISRDFSDDFGQTSQKPQDETENMLPFGSYNDPLRSLTLSALFPFWQDGLYDDAQSTNMDALTAKQWVLSREFAPANQQRANLSNIIEQIIGSWIKDPCNSEYLAPYDEGNDESVNDRAMLLRNLFLANSSRSTSSSASGSMADSTGGTRSGDEQVTVVKSDQIEEVLNNLFSRNKVPLYNNKAGKEDQKEMLDTKKLVLKFRASSSVPYGSFLWNLLLFTIKALANGNTNPNSRRQHFADFMGFFRIVWTEVLRKIRWHWENLEPIPDVSPYLYDDDNDEDHNCTDPKKKKILGIDLRFNILHQKLSMVNCCIYRQRQNNSTQSGKGVSSKEQTILDNKNRSNLNNERPGQSKKQTGSPVIDDSDSTEEFFDTVEDVEGSINIVQRPVDEELEEPGSAHPLSESYVRLPFVAMFNNEEAEAAAIKDPNRAEGQLCEHTEGLKLLKTGEPLQVPVTQDPGFMTEDMIKEQAEAFENMGSSDRATLKRAQLQSRQLYSDMQAFKAANPHACLEDFVRWHSPRDWIVPEGSKNEEGHLSKRMSEPNNIWQELWNCSHRIPCSRQSPLFNIYTEAEKALFFLETTSVHELFSTMLPTLGLIAYDTLVNHPVVEHSRLVIDELLELRDVLIHFPWDDLRFGKKTIDSITSQIRQVESMMCNAISLLRKVFDKERERVCVCV